VLPTVVPIAAIAPASTGASRPWSLAVAVADDDLQPAALLIHEAEHVLVAGPPRSGRTTALLAIEAAFRHAVPDGMVTVFAPPRSPLAPRAGAPVPDRGRVLVLVDDADRMDDTEGVLAALLAAGDTRPDVHVVAAARPDALRARYDHWARTVRRSGVGLLLQPDADVDGDLLGVRLPRRPPVPRVAGRGYLVADGSVRLVQVASPAP
jgi:S-DNA-T family DNA segregation ATPase FtsK/SpoIIIE